MDLEKLDEFGKVSIRLRVTPNQNRYIKAIRSSSITICSGPAGCGKTYLAVAEALRALLSLGRPDKKIERILLLRPAITAGESIGFLPGSLEEKTSFYMRPFHDAGIKLIGRDLWTKYVGCRDIEFETMSYVRGITWDKTFVIVDEAQNCTPKQMEMLLTRLGKCSKIVVTGDRNQPDLPNECGLTDAISRLEHREIPGLSFCELTGEDNMRHPIVKAIAKVYEKPVVPLTAFGEVKY